MAYWSTTFMSWNQGWMITRTRRLDLKLSASDHSAWRSHQESKPYKSRRGCSGWTRSQLNGSQCCMWPSDLKRRWHLSSCMKLRWAWKDQMWNFRGFEIKSVGQTRVCKRVEERLKKIALIVKEWVDQRELLAHQSVKGFLSHCGWNSVMEMLKYSF